MTTRRTIIRASALIVMASLLRPTLSHIEMSWPYSLRSKYNPDTPEASIDYNMMAPLHSSGSEFPCRGYQNDNSIQPSIIYEAGSSYNMSLEGSAVHGGGSCQISLSYDNGATFRVIKSMIGGCPLKSTYDFTIPSYAPTGSALLAWTWSNLVGNREFYMNCAAVSIQPGTTPKRRRRDFQSMKDLPFIWKADLTQINECATVEGTIPVYPHPGPDVEYGDGMDELSPQSSGQCDSPTPYGPMYTATGDATPDLSYNAASSGQAIHQHDEEINPSPSLDLSVLEESVSLATTAATEDATPDVSYNAASSGQEIKPEGGIDSPPSPGLSVLEKGISLASTATPTADIQVFSLNIGFQRVGTTGDSGAQSTTTVTIDCADITTITMFPIQSPATTNSAPPMYTTSSPLEACFGTSANCPCNPGYSCRLIGTCTWACIADSIASTPTMFITSRTTPTAVAATTTSRPLPADSPTPQPSQSPPPPPTDGNPPPPTSNNRPPYVSVADLSARIPCVPGTFICTSETTFYTCDVSQNGAWSYKFPREVAADMLCLTNLSLHNFETEQYRQQGQTVSGYYRDDRYVRARPDGDCDVEGGLLCTDGGSMFNICDQGGWIRMGAVAPGTTCRDGVIEAS